MKTLGKTLTWCCLAIILTGIASAALAEDDAKRPSLWVDLYHGEPIHYEHVIADLAGVDVVFLGEVHSVKRHHEIQEAILRDLAEKNPKLVLGLEQMEHVHQPQLDKFNAGEIDFAKLAEATQWPDRWHNYKQYEGALKIAREFKIPVLALNAQSKTIRQVARGGGVAKLDPEVRKELPEDLQLKDPLYEKLLNMYLMVHMAATPERLRPMLEAQISRDEMMASVLCKFLKSEQGKGRTAVVLCGSGHVSYGLGTVSRVARRLPEAKYRVVLPSESGDLVLTESQKAASRPITITHEQLREINRPIADYLHVIGIKSAEE